MAEKPESGRGAVSERYRGHHIDINTAVDRFSILQDGADPNPSPLDEDTKVKLGPKTQENPNDPYNC